MVGVEMFGHCKSQLSGLGSAECQHLAPQNSELRMEGSSEAIRMVGYVKELCSTGQDGYGYGLSTNGRTSALNVMYLYNTSRATVGLRTTYRQSNL